MASELVPVASQRVRVASELVPVRTQQVTIGYDVSPGPHGDGFAIRNRPPALKMRIRIVAEGAEDR